MKDYMTIHINKRTLKFILHTLFWLFIVFGFLSWLFLGYSMIREDGYNEGYDAGIDDFANKVLLNDEWVTINNLSGFSRTYYTYQGYQNQKIILSQIQGSTKE